jgi:uncharacterized membrane protein YkvA (DUF1232 family)
MAIKIFFSHAWGTKTSNPAVAELLLFLEREVGAEVWKDNEQMSPGAHLHAALQAAIDECDIFLLAASPAALASDDVNFEIRTAQRLTKPIVACKIEPVDVDRDPILKELLFVEWGEAGAARWKAESQLKSAIFAAYRPRLAEDDQRTVTELNRLEAQLGDMLDARKERGRANNRAEAVRALRSAARMGDEPEAQFFAELEAIVAEKDAARGDPDRLRALIPRLQQMEGRGGLEAMACSRLREEIEAQLGEPTSGDRAHGRGRELRGGPPDAQPRSAAPEDPLAHARAFIAARLPGAQADAQARQLLAYVSAATPVLQTFCQQVAGVPGLMRVAAGLRAYFTMPVDLMPDHLGVLGMLDDAYLVLNTVAACVDQGILDPTSYPIDWVQIAQTNAVVEALLPPQVLQGLQSALMRLLGGVQAGLQEQAGLLGGPQAGWSPAAAPSFEQTREDLAPSLGGMFLKYGV